MPERDESRALVPKEVWDQLREHYRASTRISGEGYKWKRRQSMQSPEVEELPYVPHPSGFQKDVPVVGSPEYARIARRLLDLDPGTKERVSKVMVGPTRGSMMTMQESGLPPDWFPGTNLMGVYNREVRDGVRDEVGEIGINPRRELDIDTLVHELAHASGYDETGAEEAQNIWKGRRLR